MALDRIYSVAEIDAAKASPSFEREYNLKYLGLIGNVFHTKDIEVSNGERVAIYYFDENVRKPNHILRSLWD